MIRVVRAAVAAASIAWATAPAPAAPAASLYVADASARTVLRFPLANDIPAGRPAGTLMLNAVPEHLAVGPPGSLFVSYRGRSGVDVFASSASGRTAPLRTLALGAAPSGIAVDPAGYLYVSGLETGAIDIFAPGASGNAAPFARVVAPTMSRTSLVALDPQGRLFFSNSDEGLAALLEYANPLEHPRFVRQIGFQTTRLTAVAIDVMHEAYVLTTAIQAYSPSACCLAYPPDRTLGPLDQTFVPVAIAIRNRHAFVASASTSLPAAALVDTFDLFAGAQTPLAVIAGSFLPRPVAVAVDL